jgi:hypothetical protein
MHPRARQRVSERASFALETRESNVLNQTVSIMVGESPHHVQLHGFLPCMATRSKWVSELLMRHLNEGIEGEALLSKGLHIAKHLRFDTEPRREALRGVWGYLNSIGTRPRGFDEQVLADFVRQTNRVRVQRFDAQKALMSTWSVQERQSIAIFRERRGAIDQARANIPGAPVPPIEPVARNVWVARFEMLEHMRTLIDYFDVELLSGYRYWDEWLLDLAQTYPRDADLDGSLRRDLAQLMHHHTVTRLKKGSKERSMMERALCLLERRCTARNCRAPLSNELIEQWRKLNGLRLTYASERHTRTKELHLCDEHLHTHTARTSGGASLLVCQLLRKSARLDETICFAPEGAVLRRVTVATRDDATPTVAIDNFPGPDYGTATAKDKLECSTLSERLSRIPDRYGYAHARNRITINYQHHLTTEEAAAAAAAVPVVIDDEEEEEEGDDEVASEEEKEEEQEDEA